MDGWDRNGLQLEKYNLASFFKFFLCIEDKSLATDYSSFFSGAIP